MATSGPPRTDATAFDGDVRLAIYRYFVAHAAPPGVGEVARALGAGEPAVRDAYERLAAGHVIVLRPGTHEVLMAAPLSAVPTAFRVTLDDGRAYWGNCIWDALGVSAMLGADARIDTRCGDCDAPMGVRTDGARVVGEGVVHFALPARRWWEDIVFT